LRVPIRGGNWNNGANAGVFYTNLNNARSNSNTNIGFRSALLLVGRYFSGRSKEHPRKASTKGACFRPEAGTG